MLAILVLDLGLVAGGVLESRSRALERRKTLSRSIGELEKQLPVLQKESDDARQAILNAVDALDELLNLGRAPSSVGIAQQKLGAAVELMQAARAANARLPFLTQEIIAKASRGRSGAGELEVVASNKSARYLVALGDALEVMMETHRMYSEMNPLLAEGMSVYEELIALTSDYLTKYGSGFFGDDAEAAAWYTLRANKPVTKIESFKARLETTYSGAQEAARRAERAFDRVEELAGR